MMSNTQEPKESKTTVPRGISFRRLVVVDLTLKDAQKGLVSTCPLLKLQP